MWAIQDNLRCLTSPLGHMYCYSDGAPLEMRQLEFIWFLGITIGIQGLSFLAILCCVGFTRKSRKVVMTAFSVLVFALPIVVGFILVAAPEGYLAADTAYGRTAIHEIYVRMVPVGITLAILPWVASLGAQHFLKHRIEGQIRLQD